MKYTDRDMIKESKGKRENDCYWKREKKKRLKLSVALPPDPVWVQANSPLPWVSCQSHLLANDKGDNEMIPGAVHRSPGVYLIAEANLRKLQLGDRMMKAVWQSSPQIGSNTSRWCRQDHTTCEEWRRKGRSKGWGFQKAKNLDLGPKSQYFSLSSMAPWTMWKVQSNFIL